MVRRREFTYQEKKFNRLGRQGLIDSFKQKYDPEKIQIVFLSEYDQQLSRIEAKAIATKLEEDDFQKSKDFIEPMVDGIIYFSRMFDLTNIEAFAMWCHVMRDIGLEGKRLGRELSEEELDKVMETSMRRAYELYEERPNKFLDILKLFR